MSVVLAEPHPAADKSKTHGINGTRPTTHLRVDNIDARYAALSKVALFPPERTHWGTRWFVARDPDGNLIAFEQPEAARGLYMVIERFKKRDAVPVYRRFRERGRMAPQGLDYVSSWVDLEMGICYQVMETADPALLEQWIANWKDLVDFEVRPVMTSKEAAEAIAPRLG